MKFLKYILFLLLIGFIGLSIYIAVQPNAFEVSKSRSINAPASVIFETVKDTSQVDFSSFWKQTETLNTVSNNTKDSIHQSFSSDGIPKSELSWIFKPNGNGSTEVIRSLKVSSLSFLTKAKSVIFGGNEKEIATQFEKDLETLDTMVLKSMGTYSIKVDGITEYGGGFYMYKTTSSTASNVNNMRAKQDAEILNFMQDNAIEMNGNPFTIYIEMNDNGNVIMSNAIPVQNKVTVADDSNILCGYMDRMTVLKTTLKGNYTNLDEAWKTAMQYLKDHNLEASDVKPFEIYMNEPAEVPNPSNWITELYIPLKTKTIENASL